MTHHIIRHGPCISLCHHIFHFFLALNHSLTRSVARSDFIGTRKLYQCQCANFSHWPIFIGCVRWFVVGSNAIRMKAFRESSRFRSKLEIGIWPLPVRTLPHKLMSNVNYHTNCTGYEFSIKLLTIPSHHITSHTRTYIPWYDWHGLKLKVHYICTNYAHFNFSEAD